MQRTGSVKIWSKLSALFFTSYSYSTTQILPTKFADMTKDFVGKNSFFEFGNEI